MARVKIADLFASSPVDPDPERVELYRQSIDLIAPVVVFKTGEGLLLADGYHRIAAAAREGRDSVEVVVRSGSRREALEYVASVGARQRGLSSDDVKTLILRKSRGQVAGSDAGRGERQKPPAKWKPPEPEGSSGLQTGE